MRRLPALVVLGVLAACTPTPPAEEGQAPEAPPAGTGLTLTAVTYADLPGWALDRHTEALAAYRRSCGRLQAKPPDLSMGVGGKAAVWQAACAAATEIRQDDEAVARYFFEKWFRPYRATAGEVSEGLLTGYYEAELRGARTRNDRYRVPIHRRPADLVAVSLGQFRGEWKGQRIAGRVRDGRFVPYATRAEIRNGALDGRGLSLLWVDDPADAFFLHVQGSGRVVLEDGSVVRVGYAANNGHPYVSIGRELVDDGALAKDAVSMEAIRAWLQGNPAKAPALLDRNPRYIFFKEVPGEGPVGAQGVVLIAGRSLAVDTDHVPLGTPIWLEARDPVDAEQPLRRLVIAQDTGAAIKGPVRGDLFWGFGHEAARRAGAMNERARFHLLLPVGAMP